MQVLARHLILVSAESKIDAEKRIRHFFDNTSLVRYDRISIAEPPLAAAAGTFQERLSEGLAENRRLLKQFIGELGTAGCQSRQDLAELPQGYQSKVLHIIAHFLDGFIGIDSAFYNLVDDSHWLTEQTEKAIQDQPDRFWLFSLEGFAAKPETAVLLHR